jgi:polar amino acid transport system substrate-binding protein
MNKNKKNHYLVLLLSVLLVGYSAQSLCKTTKNLKSIKIWIPQLTINHQRVDELKPVIKLLSQAYAHLGYKMELKELPALRAQYMSSGSSIDGELLRVDGYDKVERNVVKVPVPLVRGNIVAVGIGDKIKPFSIDKAKALTIGCLRGAIITEKVCSAFEHRFVVNSLDQLIGLLKLGRMDLILVFDIPSIVNKYHLTQSPFHIYQPPVFHFEAYHYLNKKHEDLVMPLANELKKLKAAHLN